jgi:hypothetical protein
LVQSSAPTVSAMALTAAVGRRCRFTRPGVRAAGHGWPTDRSAFRSAAERRCGFVSIRVRDRASRRALMAAKWARSGLFVHTVLIAKQRVTGLASTKATAGSPATCPSLTPLNNNAQPPTLRSTTTMPHPGCAKMTCRSRRALPTGRSSARRSRSTQTSTNTSDRLRRTQNPAPYRIDMRCTNFRGSRNFPPRVLTPTSP